MAPAEAGTGTAGATEPIARASITGLVLAGGLGRRMSADGRGLDKALVPLRGRPMVAHVIERLAPQVGALLLNTNRPAADYAGFGLPVVADAVGGFAGPLAGLHAGLSAARTDWVASVPCDSPLLPADLVRRLADAAAQAGARIAMARTGEQPHPVFALVERALQADLHAFLAAGGRKIDAWMARHPTVEVDFADAAAFGNINTPDDLRRHDA